jgi:hypothetical protein
LPRRCFLRIRESSQSASFRGDSRLKQRLTSTPSTK